MVVQQQRQRNVQKECAALANLHFLLIRPIDVVDTVVVVFFLAVLNAVAVLTSIT